jgi:hypothetical protein
MDSGEIMMLRFIESNISHQFMELREYYNEIVLVIKNKKQYIIHKNDRLQQQLKNEPEEIKEQHYDNYFDDFYIVDMVEHIFCNSMIISIYTLIEKNIKELCEHLKDINHISIPHTDLKGDGIERAKKYINKLCGLNMDQNDLVFLSGINAIRNIIAHGNGELYNISNKNLNKILAISKKAPGCKIEQSDYLDEDGNKKTIYQNIELEFDFVDYCLEKGTVIFKNLFQQIF